MLAASVIPAGVDGQTGEPDGSGVAAAALRPALRAAPTTLLEHEPIGRLPSVMGAGSGPPPSAHPERVMLLSAALPGAGQYVQGQRRWMAYAAAELVGWLLVIDRRRKGGHLRNRYRDLAWTAAREELTEGPRADGAFGYYEDLLRWQRSGAFDRDPERPGLQPETDPGTFNGSIWALARGLFFPPDAPDPEPGDPSYERALEYYEEEAYDPDFLWDWSEAPESWLRYGRTIERSDDRFREATLLTGAVVANHLLSAVDAFVSARLTEGAGRNTRLTTRIGPGPRGDWGRSHLDLTLSFHIRGP